MREATEYRRLTYGQFCRTLKSEKIPDYETSLRLLVQIKKLHIRKSFKRVRRKKRKEIEGALIMAVMAKMHHEDRGKREPEWFVREIERLKR